MEGRQMNRCCTAPIAWIGPDRRTWSAWWREAQHRAEVLQRGWDWEVAPAGKSVTFRVYVP